MNLEIAVSIPDLWGEQNFQKKEWGSINYLVGPNATGKTQFAEQLRRPCQDHGLKVRYLSTERLSGLERKRYAEFSMSHIDRGFDIQRFEDYKRHATTYGLVADAFTILKQKLDIKIEIEASLSQLFGRKIRLAEAGGFMKPKIQRIEGGNEYDLKESECHGLKELITLLTFLYGDEYNCLIIDEPELHLHPQFQTFFLQKIRNIAGDPRNCPNKKCFFLVTHSPYFVDIRTLEDLKHCIVFQPDKLPAFINELDVEDEWKIRRLLPRLNTHHKQFFFATRPIFVEGYFDQQIFSLIQEKRGKLLGASGSCIIDVGGKEELDLFFRLCKKLNIDAQFITDLDILFQGRLKQSVSKDQRCREYLQTEGLEIDLMKAIGGLEKSIDDCVSELDNELATRSPSNDLMRHFVNSLSKTRELHKKRCVFLVGLCNIGEQLKVLISDNKEKLSLIEGKLQKIMHAFRFSGVHSLRRGQLENYLPEYKGNPYLVSDEAKPDAFEKERDFILSEDTTESMICERYTELVTILDQATRSKQIDIRKHLNEYISRFIFEVQLAYNRGEIINESSLKRNTLIDWGAYSRLFDLIQFSSDPAGFNCRIKLKGFIDPTQSEIVFDNRISAANFQIHKNDTPINSV